MNGKPFVSVHPLSVEQIPSGLQQQPPVMGSPGETKGSDTSSPHTVFLPRVFNSWKPTLLNTIRFSFTGILPPGNPRGSAGLIEKLKAPCACVPGTVAAVYQLPPSRNSGARGWVATMGMPRLYVPRRVKQRYLLFCHSRELPPEKAPHPPALPSFFVRRGVIALQTSNNSPASIRFMWVRDCTSV